MSHKLAHFRIWQYKSVEDNMFPPVSLIPYSEHFWGILQCAHEILYSHAPTHARTLKLTLTFGRSHFFVHWVCVCVCDTRSMSSQHHQMDMQSVTSLQFFDVTREKYAKLIAFHSTWLFFSLSLSHMNCCNNKTIRLNQGTQAKREKIAIRYEWKKLERRRRSSVYWETETVC